MTTRWVSDFAPRWPEGLWIREIEKTRIACARKVFAKITSEQIRYEVVDGYGKLMELVKNSLCPKEALGHRQ